MLDDPSAEAVVSHGLCEDCLARMRVEGEFTGLLNELAVPILVTNHEMLVLGANPAAENFIGKPVGEMKNRLAGPAVDCFFASVNGGCGTNAECRLCVLRNTVDATHTDGQPRYGVYSRHEILTGEYSRPAQLRFSTTKLKSLILLLIEEVRMLGSASKSRPSTKHPFAKLYCDAHALPPEQFVPVMFQHSLYWWVRPLAPLLHRCFPDYFRVDQALLANVGAARRPEEVADAIFRFHAHPDNRRFLRRALLLRVSPGKIIPLFQAVTGMATDSDQAIRGRTLKG